MSADAANPPFDSQPSPDWRRFFPSGDHRWAMGLRRGDAKAFFALGASAEAVRAERARWLAVDPRAYAALTPAAATALAETIDLARAWGMPLPTSLEPWERLLSLGRHWEADLVWLVADERGTYRVAGGVVCFPSSWALQEKLGRTLGETHDPVPGLNTTLGRQIETFLAKLVPGEAWRRENAGFSRSGEKNQHPDRPRRPLDSTVTLDEVRVRLEHQLLLKLPVSRSLLFGIRVEVVPLLQAIERPSTATDLVRLLETMSPAAAEYKGLAAARDAILSSIRRMLEAKSPSDPPDSFKETP